MDSEKKTIACAGPFHALHLLLVHLFILSNLFFNYFVSKKKKERKLLFALHEKEFQYLPHCSKYFVFLYLH